MEFSFRTRRSVADRRPAIRQVTEIKKTASMRRMTDAANTPLGLGERVGLTVLLGLIALLVVADALSDLGSGGAAGHVAVELAVAGSCAVGVALLWARYLRTRTALDAAHDTIRRARADAEAWRQRNENILRGLAVAIDAQLDAWRLTPAEKEVAFLLLKGLSFKEVAQVRAASERTVRQQALAVYAKSGVAGRAELAAFFLEDLLVPRA
jgi:DNA-binding CsgD family transcriptional regulator